MSKKDRGKGIEKSDNSKIIRHPGTFQDIQVLVQNKFDSLTNYPPLPFKTVVIGSSSKPHDLYHIKHTEHLFLTYLTTLSLPILRPLVQRSFGNFHYRSEYLVKT